MTAALRPRALAALGQLALIAVDVYLGTQAEEWRGRRERREATRATLANFRAELALRTWRRTRSRSSSPPTTA